MNNRVLIIEDNLINNEVLKSGLELKGFQVTQAFDGQQGMKLIHEMPFDLAVVDLDLPVIHGTKIIKSLENKPAPPEIIVFSGRTFEFPEANSPRVFAVCEKPMPLWDFIAVCIKATEKPLNKPNPPPPQI